MVHCFDYSLTWICIRIGLHCPVHIVVTGDLYLLPSCSWTLVLVSFWKFQFLYTLSFLVSLWKLQFQYCTLLSCICSFLFVAMLQSYYLSFGLLSVMLNLRTLGIDCGHGLFDITVLIWSVNLYPASFLLELVEFGLLVLVCFKLICEILQRVESGLKDLGLTL